MGVLIALKALEETSAPCDPHPCKNSPVSLHQQARGLCPPPSQLQPKHGADTWEPLIKCFSFFTHPEAFVYEVESQMHLKITSVH